MEDNELRVYRDKCIDLSGQCIEVVVGSEHPTLFSVHERLICSASEFFNRAMNGSWKTSEDRSVQLKNHEPEVFVVYLNWLYSHVLPVRIDSPGDEGNAEYIQLAKAYILGDEIQDGSFKDAVIDAMLQKTRSRATDGRLWNPTGEAIRVIYDNTVDSSMARRLLVDIYTCYGHGFWLTEHARREDIPKDFLYDLAIAVLDKRIQPEKLPISPCRYHEHGSDSGNCYKRGSGGSKGPA